MAVQQFTQPSGSVLFSCYSGRTTTLPSETMCSGSEYLQKGPRKLGQLEEGECRGTGEPEGEGLEWRGVPRRPQPGGPVGVGRAVHNVSDTRTASHDEASRCFLSYPCTRAPSPPPPRSPFLWISMPSFACGLLRSNCLIEL